MLITRKDLAAVKILNTSSISGVDNSLLGYEYFIKNENCNNIHLWNRISELKKIHFQRFKYENLPDGLTMENIEEQLFLWGKVCIFELGGVYRATNFAIKKNDFYMNPKIIQPMPKIEKIKIRELKVNKDCILIYNDNSFYWGKTWYGSLFQVWDWLILLDLTYKYIHQNLPFIPNALYSDDETDIKDVSNMTKEIKSSKSVKTISKEANLENLSIDNGLFKFENKTDELIKSYEFLLEKIKTSFGISSIFAPDKKERMITDEINLNNSVSDSIIENQLENRKKGIEDFNKLTKNKFNTLVKINAEEKILLKGEETDENKSTNISKK